MYDAAAKALKDHIEIMTHTFEANNLQVLHLGVKPYSSNDADCNLLVELASIEGSSISADLTVKINMYDKDEDLYLVKCGYLKADTFSGFDTLSISCYSDGKTLKKAISGKLYVTKT